MSLARYQAKRDFNVTREPRGAKKRTAGLQQGEVLFVVQKHAASRLHYDFRLGIAGVLKSWAVPKGIPLQLGEKRLAVEVEDHPLEYGGFEGTIPPGNYGAGTVMLWDVGICEVEGPNPADALKRGKLVFNLQGKKLRGDWTLVRMRPRPGLEEKSWLMIKINQEAKPVSARSDDRSFLSGKTMKQLAATAGNIWTSQRSADSKKPSVKIIRKSVGGTKPARRIPLSRHSRHSRRLGGSDRLPNGSPPPRSAKGGKSQARLRPKRPPNTAKRRMKT